MRNKLREYRYVILIIALAVIVSASLSVFRTIAFRSWTYTGGTIEHAEILRGRHSGRSVRYSYSYSVSGCVYSGADTLSFSGQPDYRAGDQITVWYDPDKPSVSEITKPGVGIYAVVPFIISVPALILNIGLIRKRKTLI